MKVGLSTIAETSFCMLISCPIATEPFNEALDRRIWALNAERIGWDISVSEIRKQRPFHLRQTKQEMEQKRMAAEWLPDTDAAEDNQGETVLLPERDKVGS